MHHRYAHGTGAELPDRQPNEKAKQVNSWPDLTQHHDHHSLLTPVHWAKVAHGPVGQGPQNEKATQTGVRGI